MSIYKVVGNDKWHLLTPNGKTYCGVSSSKICESKKIGIAHKDCQPDPPKEHLCLICFEFLEKGYQF